MSLSGDDGYTQAQQEKRRGSVQKESRTSDQRKGERLPFGSGAVEGAVSLDIPTKGYLVEKGAGHSVIVGHVAQGTRLLEGGEDGL